MEATEEPFQRDLQHVQFCDVKLYATIRSGSEAADKLNGKRKDLVYGAVQLELVALRLNRDVLERCVGRRADVKVVADVTYVGVDDAFLDLNNEGLWSSKELSCRWVRTIITDPTDVDAEVGPLRRSRGAGRGGGRDHQRRRCQLMTGPSATEGMAGADGRPRIPEEPAERDWQPWQRWRQRQAGTGH
jgi:hypothetical protein